MQIGDATTKICVKIPQKDRNRSVTGFQYIQRTLYPATQIQKEIFKRKLVFMKMFSHSEKNDDILLRHTADLAL